MSTPQRAEPRTQIIIIILAHYKINIIKIDIKIMYNIIQHRFNTKS